MSEKLPNDNLKKMGANYLKLLQEASRVSRLAWLEDDKELGTIATSGLRCLESSKNLSPAGLLQKMSEALLTSKTAWSSKMCVLIWKVKATKHKRLLYQLQASVPRIAETESGLWLTPNSMDSLPPRNEKALKKQYQKNRKGRTTHSTLREQVVYPPPNKLWRTPDALSGGSNLPGIKKALNQGHLKRPSGQPIQIRLHDQVREKRLWPTPTSTERSGINPKTGKGAGLSKVAKMWPTPREFMYKDSKIDRGKSNLGEVVGGTLNPTWVEWLMGYKAGYTDLKDWAILSSHKSQKKSVKQ